LINKIHTFDESKEFIIKKDSLKEVKKEPFATSSFIKKNELDKTDNIAVFNSVKKYNEDKTKIN